MKIKLSLLLGFALMSITARAANVERVTWTCGSSDAGGGFFSETGVVQCANDAGADRKEITSKESEIYCMYNALCTPATKAVREAIESGYAMITKKPKVEFSKISDDAVAETLTKLVRGNLFQLESMPETYSVMCLGKKVDGKPDCPKLNACVNNRGLVAQYWNVRPLQTMDKFAETPIQGARVRTEYGVPMPAKAEVVK